MSEIAIAGAGVTVTSGGASASVAIPSIAGGAIPTTRVRLVCPSGHVFVKPGVTGVTATTDDLLVNHEGVILTVGGYTHLAYIQGSAGELLNITPVTCD